MDNYNLIRIKHEIILVLLKTEKKLGCLKYVSRITKGIFKEKGKCKSTDKLQRTTRTRPKRQKHNTKN